MSQVEAQKSFQGSPQRETLPHCQGLIRLTFFCQILQETAASSGQQAQCPSPKEVPPSTPQVAK